MQKILEDLKDPELRKYLGQEAKLAELEDALEQLDRTQQIVQQHQLVKRRGSLPVRRAVRNACLVRHGHR